MVLYLLLGTEKVYVITVVVAPELGVNDPLLTEPFVILKLGAEVPPLPLEEEEIEIFVYPDMEIGSLTHVQE